MASRAGLIFGREPVLFRDALAALILLGVGFGLPLSGAQVALLNAAALALTSFAVRQRVTPV